MIHLRDSVKKQMFTPASPKGIIDNQLRKVSSEFLPNFPIFTKLKLRKLKILVNTSKIWMWLSSKIMIQW